MRYPLFLPVVVVAFAASCTHDYDQFDATEKAAAGGSSAVGGSGGGAGTGGSGTGGLGGTAGVGGVGGGSGGTGGTAGAGGTGGAGGTAGDGGTGGAAGDGGTGGAAGDGGTGGAAGDGGTGGSGGTVVTVEVRITNGADDIEQRTTDGAMYLDSTDLELGDDPDHWGEQDLGLRFVALDIPQGASIQSAYVEFEVDEASNEATSVLFEGQLAGNAGAFTTDDWNLTSRATTVANVAWDGIPGWAVDSKERSPDLAAIVQEIVNRPGWAPQHNMVFVIRGTGRRVAESVEGEAAAAPLLHVEYIAP